MAAQLHSCAMRVCAVTPVCEKLSVLPAHVYVGVCECARVCSDDVSMNLWYALTGTFIYMVFSALRVCLCVQRHTDCLSVDVRASVCYGVTPVSVCESV